MTLDRHRLGSLFPSAGRVGARSAQVWMPTTICGSDCPIYNECPYEDQTGSPCRFEFSYMKAIYTSIINEDPEKGIADKLDDIEHYRVGYHLMPLYRQLARFKKLEFSVKHLTTVDKQGKESMHPVFKAIQEVITKISKEINDLGLHKKWKEKYGTTGGPGLGPSIEDMFERGDPSFHDSLSKSGKDKG